MRMFSLLLLAPLTLLPAVNVNAAFSFTQPELAFPLRLATSGQLLPAKKKHSRQVAQKSAIQKKGAVQAPAIAPPAPAPAEPKIFLPPQAARIVPSGILSVGGAVQPLAASGAPISPNGFISIPKASRAVYLQPVNPATRDVEIAQLEMTQFLYSDYPAQLRQFDSQITVTQAEIVALQQRLASYSQFDKFINNANPLFESQRLATVTLVDAQQRLSNLQYERGRLQQWLPVEIRRRQLELHRTLTPPAPVVKAPAPYDASFDDDQDRNRD